MKASASLSLAPLRVLLLGALLALSAGVQASPGHDHGDAPRAAAGTASPRLEAHSELFELVGVVDKGRMTVYLDRWATNEPVTGAKIEYESGAAKGIAAPQPDGTYLIAFDALGKPGELQFAFTVSAGSDSDLLAGDLSLADPHDHGPEAGRPWLRYAGYAAGAALALALALGLARKFRNRSAATRA